MAIRDFYRGDTKRYKFTFSKNGSPVNLTGYEIWFTVKANLDDLDSAAILQVKATAGGDPGDDVANGIMYVTADSTDTEVEPGSYQYDFQRVIPGAPPDVRTLDKDKVKILPDVTRSNT
jgi:hypothetical protein